MLSVLELSLCFVRYESVQSDGDAVYGPEVHTSSPYGSIWQPGQCWTHHLSQCFVFNVPINTLKGTESYIVKFKWGENEVLQTSLQNATLAIQMISRKSLHKHL